MSFFDAVGSALRAVMSRALVRAPDRKLRAAIGRLDKVASAQIAEHHSRRSDLGSTIDDVADRI